AVLDSRRGRHDRARRVPGRRLLDARDRGAVRRARVPDRRAVDRLPALMPPRVLILTASVGEGHDLPARTLTAQLEREEPAVESVGRGGLAGRGPAVGAVSEGAPRVVFYRFQWLWDVGFWFFARLRPTRRLTQEVLTAVGAPGLLRLVDRHRPDVVVSTYPH